MISNKPPVPKEFEKGANAVLTLAGMHHEPTKGSKFIGYTQKGDPVYSQLTFARSDSLHAGALLLHGLAGGIAPFNILSPREQDALKKWTTASSSSSLIKKLDAASKNKTPEEFCSILIAAVGATQPYEVVGVSCVKVYEHWPMMSPAQKSLSIAATGLRGYKTKEGGTVCDLKIIDGKGQKLNVRDALDLMRQQKFPYALVQNWDQIYLLHQVSNGLEVTPQSMADFAKSNRLTSVSTHNASVPGVTADSILRNGGRPAPQYGVGAVALPPNSKNNEGYVKAVASEKGDIHIPIPNAKSAKGALSESLLGTKAGDDGVNSNATKIYKSWEKPKTKDKGSLGGSQLIFGLNGLKESNNYLFGAMVAFLAHYSIASVKDGNLLEYVACLAGISLARVVSGKKSTQTEIEGIQVTGNVSKKTFDELQTNLRSVYARFGLNSKADAYQLTNQAYSEDRINESDLVAMQQVFDIIYDDNGYVQAQRLWAGKNRGLEVISQRQKPAKNTMTDGHTTEEVELAVKKAPKEVQTSYGL